MIAWDLRSAKEHPALDAGAPPPGLLSAPERVFFERLKTPRRRREWLLGRWAVKGLVRAVLASRGEPFTASELTVAPDPSGAPYVLAPFRGRLPLTVTLSHREDLALVALSDRPEAPLGADLEKCEPRSAGFVDDFFTEREAALAFASPDQDRCVTEIWSLKEAALKALRLGLTVDTRRIEASPRAETASGWRPAAVDLSLQFVRSRGHAYVRDVGGYVATLAWLGATPFEAPSAEYRGGPVLDEPCGCWPVGEQAIA